MTPETVRLLVSAAMIGLVAGVVAAFDGPVLMRVAIGVVVIAGIVLGITWAAADIAADRRGRPQRRQ